jgi:hypothetical protein
MATLNGFLVKVFIVVSGGWMRLGFGHYSSASLGMHVDSILLFVYRV